MLVPSLDDADQWRRASHATVRSELDLFRTEKDSDIKIKCDGYTWNLHKSVLCDRSRLFRDVLTGSPDPNHDVVSTGRGICSHLLNDGVMTIDGFSDEEVEIALVYLCAGIFPTTLKHDATAWECYRIFEVAEYLALDGLQELSIRALIKSLERLEEALCHALTAKALQHGQGGDDLDGDIAAELREAFPEETLDDLHEICESAATNSGFEALQQPMLDFMEATVWVFFDPGDALEAFEVLLDQDSALWFELVEAIMGGKSATQAAEAIALSRQGSSASME
ncbi:uncharacterized protein PG986_010679 [Apiospora aurea]|uniref:BTB domain-containing protein n=1 Tax=Apiospora aurea TaxID=335848 RepID=A0ABR1Q487_9PEZI